MLEAFRPREPARSHFQTEGPGIRGSCCLGRPSPGFGSPSSAPESISLVTALSVQTVPAGCEPGLRRVWQGGPRGHLASSQGFRPLCPPLPKPWFPFLQN